MNGYSQTQDAAHLHYDLPQYRPFWRVVEASMFRSICIRARPRALAAL